MSAPKWLEREVSNGLQALLTLGLKRAPSADVVGMTLDVWLAAIVKRFGAGLDEGRDAKRIRDAFAQLFARREWPTPADFLDAMPSRPPQAALPAPKLTDAERAANLERLAAITKQFFQTKQMR